MERFACPHPANRNNVAAPCICRVVSNGLSVVYWNGLCLGDFQKEGRETVASQCRQTALDAPRSGHLMLLAHQFGGKGSAIPRR
jgi:hypothetical protein